MIQKIDEWLDKKSPEQIEKLQIIVAAVMAVLTMAVLCLSVVFQKQGFWLFAAIIPFALSLAIPRFLENHRSMDVKPYNKALAATMAVCIIILLIYGLITGQL